MGGRTFPAIAFAALAMGLGAPNGASAQNVERGRVVYDRWCAECHGAEGRGDGPAAAWMLPRPRDFVQARYQIRTTANGELPTDDDLRAILEHGMPGTAMPAWPNLGEAEREDVIAYIKAFSPFFEDAPPEAMDFSSDPGGGEEALAAGAEVYRELECWKCHGDAGRGDGGSAPTLEDWRELPIRAADLTEPWAFNGGMGAEAIHRRLLTGLDGTPMPAYSDALASEVVTADELWHLARYVHSLGPAGAPVVDELIAARRVEDGLPASPDDEAWNRVEPSYVPLVGQVIEAPRQFAPAVDGAWVRAVHDGEELAVLVEWNDPSDSPDPAWNEWQLRIAATLPADGRPAAADTVPDAVPDRDPEPAPDAAPDAAPDPLPDGLAIQFPPSVPTGMERPYFLMGGTASPVYLWHWDRRAGFAEMRARGLGELESLGSGEIDGAASWDAGRWTLMVRRPLATGDPASLAFSEGVAIPFGLFAWDGSSAEDATRGSISAWYFLYLEEPRSAAVYVVPLLAALATGLAGIGLAAAARRRKRPSLEPAARTT